MPAKKTSHGGGISKKTAVGIGVGVTAALVSAAGAYFLYGSKNAPKNRKAVKSWMLKAKAEVLEGLEKAQDMTQDDYEALVNKSAKVYSKMKNVSAGEIADFAKEMKAHWSNLEKKGQAAKAPVKKAVKKVKKALKKRS